MVGNASLSPFTFSEDVMIKVNRIIDAGNLSTFISRYNACLTSWLGIMALLPARLALFVGLLVPSSILSGVYVIPLTAIWTFRCL